MLCKSSAYTFEVNRLGPWIACPASGIARAGIVVMGDIFCSIGE